MALTKVRPPVTDISIIDNGTTEVNIPTAGADIDINVAGANVMDISSTTVLIDPLVTLDADNIAGEQVLLATTSGAALTFETQALLARLLTTSAHPLELGANNITALTVDTAGKVELDVEGTAVNHLVTKSYIDGLAGGAISTTDVVATLTSDGSVTLPTDSGDLIINWGTNGVVGDGAVVTKTFDTPFTTAFFVGFASPSTSANHDGTLAIISTGLTSMDVQSSLDKASGFYYLAIGY